MSAAECYESWRMLTYADVCWRMLTYADGDSQGSACAHVPLSAVRRGIGAGGARIAASVWGLQLLVYEA